MKKRIKTNTRRQDNDGWWQSKRGWFLWVRWIWWTDGWTFLV